MERIGAGDMDIYVMGLVYTIVEGTRRYLINDETIVYEREGKETTFANSKKDELYLIPPGNEKLDRLLGVLEKRLWDTPFSFFCNGDRKHIELGDDPRKVYSELSGKCIFRDLKGRNMQNIIIGSDPSFIDLVSYLEFLKGEKKRSKSLDRLHKKSVNKVRAENKKRGKKGKIAVDKLPFWTGPGDKIWPKMYGYRNINCCTSSKSFSCLSPMKLGPIKEKGLVSENLENFWQFSKVWKDDLDEEGNIKEEFYKRRKKAFASKKATRHVPGKKGKYCEFVLWGEERLDFYEAKKKIYCKLYEKYAVKTQAFKELLDMIEGGYNIQILGYDGRDIKDISTFPYEEEMRSSEHIFGHEIVLAHLLHEYSR